MNRFVLLAALIVGFAALARRFGAKMRSVDWENVLERMPDNAPPKWMFRNIAAIRENTDRILELLDRDRPSTTDSDSAADSAQTGSSRSSVHLDG
jgi:hypothetical protein